MIVRYINVHLIIIIIIIIQGEIVRPQVLLDSLHPCSSRTYSWWSPPVLWKGKQLWYFWHLSRLAFSQCGRREKVLWDGYFKISMYTVSWVIIIKGYKKNALFVSCRRCGLLQSLWWSSKSHPVHCRTIALILVWYWDCSPPCCCSEWTHSSRPAIGPEAMAQWLPVCIG